MNEIISHYKECQRSYVRRLYYREKNFTFIEDRDVHLFLAYNYILNRFPCAIVFNYSKHVVETANGYYKDEFFFDLGFPRQEIQFTVSFKKMSSSVMKVVPFFKLNGLKCQLENGDKTIITDYVDITELHQIEHILKKYWIRVNWMEVLMNGHLRLIEVPKPVIGI